MGEERERERKCDVFICIEIFVSYRRIIAITTRLSLSASRISGWLHYIHFHSILSLFSVLSQFIYLQATILHFALSPRILIRIIWSNHRRCLLIMSQRMHREDLPTYVPALVRENSSINWNHENPWDNYKQKSIPKMRFDEHWVGCT